MVIAAVDSKVLRCALESLWIDAFYQGELSGIERLKKELEKQRRPR
jgi:hypothetical protein